jgi:FkbM family methyltransferase
MMSKWKYWLTLAGWKVNALLHATGLTRIPVMGRIWFSFKRLAARWIASGRGVPVQLGGQSVNIHPFTIAYGIDDWEPYTTELFKKVLKPGSTVLDIGAHHGYFSLLAARCVGPEGKVYAFEPASANFRILQKNMELNSFLNVIAVNRAVGDKNTSMAFYYRQETGVTGSLFSFQRPDESTITVECVTIDEYLAGNSVDVIKMDIEGAEPLALEGMKETVATSKEVVLFVEINPDCLSQGGVEPDGFISRLHDAGFECQIIDEDERSLKAIDGDPGFCNLYCVKTAVAT